MIVSFDLQSFGKNPKGLISVLSHLRGVNQWPVGFNREVEEIVCRTPTSALNYCRYVVGRYGVSPEAEKVFLKNPTVGIRYLRFMNREALQDESLQKRFWKKVVRNPEWAYEWCHQFRRRLSESEEEVFVKSLRRARDYALFIIKGKFPEKVHHQLVLRSFEQLQSWEKKSLTDYLSYVESSSKKVSAEG